MLVYYIMHAKRSVILVFEYMWIYQFPSAFSYVFVYCTITIVLNTVQSISQLHNGQYPKGNIDNKILRPFYDTLFLFSPFRSMSRNAWKCEKKDKMMEIGRSFICDQMKLIQMKHQGFFVETLIVNMHCRCSVCCLCCLCV